MDDRLHEDNNLRKLSKCEKENDGEGTGWKATQGDACLLINREKDHNCLPRLNHQTPYPCGHGSSGEQWSDDSFAQSAHEMGESCGYAGVDLAIYQRPVTLGNNVEQAAVQVQKFCVSERDLDMRYGAIIMPEAYRGKAMPRLWQRSSPLCPPIRKNP